MFENSMDASSRGPKFRQNKEEILALWGRKDRNGDTYYTGKLSDGTCVLAFYAVNKKQGEPDLRIFRTARKKTA